MSRITIVIDTLGGDNGAEPMIIGIKDALSKHQDVDIIVTGNENELNPLIDKYNVPKDRISVVHASEAITCHDAPVEAIRKKKDSSLVLALNLVKEGKADAIISAGNSGAILAGGQFIVGRAKGVKRTPLAPLLHHS
ncbi:MAG: phosphate acyltransferase, partial [Lachnospiraceae bacterium]|nr:phosphate acyltransferase [Lachnospiraceae bacterium]